MREVYSCSDNLYKERHCVVLNLDIRNLICTENIYHCEILVNGPLNTGAQWGKIKCLSITLVTTFLKYHCKSINHTKRGSKDQYSQFGDCRISSKARWHLWLVIQVWINITYTMTTYFIPLWDHFDVQMIQVMLYINIFHHAYCTSVKHMG